MERNGDPPQHNKSNTKGHTLRRSHAVVGDDDVVGGNKEEGDTELLAFLKDTLNKNQKDRNLILRTEAELNQFILSQSRSLPLPGPYSSYQRLLIHRVAGYLKLEHNIDSTGSGITISRGDNPPIPENERVRLRDLVEGTLSQEDKGKGRRQKTWATPHQRLLKVASVDEARAPPPQVNKAYSFGGYARHPSSFHAPTLSAQASLSPASSGYKSNSFPSMELRTPSPAGPYFTEEPPVEQPQPPSSQQPQELVLWAVSDIKSVPPGALLIDPQTLSPVRYSGHEMGPPAGLNPTQPHTLHQYYPQAPPQLGPPLQQPPIYPQQPPFHGLPYNYYDGAGDVGNWLAGMSLGPTTSFYPHHSHAPSGHHHPGVYFPPPFYYGHQPRPQPQQLRLYYTQQPQATTYPPFLLPPPTQDHPQFPPPRPWAQQNPGGSSGDAGANFQTSRNPQHVRSKFRQN